MKTKSRSFKWLRLLASSAAVLVLSGFLAERPPGPGYIAHEWGTFTSVQGGDGVLLDWRPLQTSRLPNFVYNWQNPGLGRLAAAPLLFGKGGVVSLQRMETPVIYFYAKQEQAVDVSVRFPQGLITEWYPQADQIGPSRVAASPLVAKLDNLAFEVGAKPAFTFNSFLHHAAAGDSRARWAHIAILPPGRSADATVSLPMERAGSHYFSARETDANCLETRLPGATNGAPEHEKFIFYRGVGNFQTPLRVVMDAQNAVTVANTGTEPLTHLFLLGLENRSGRFAEIGRLSPGQAITIRLDVSEHPLAVEKLSEQLGGNMAEALVQEGLYPREASAMVRTWQDSWFAEDGVRVLYVLPRAWTERTLPLTLAPAPRQLTRVMVGRAEVLSPVRQKQLTEDLVKANQGDVVAQERAQAQFEKLGRFAEPAWRLAAAQASPEVQQTGWRLFQAAAQQTPEKRL
ncbi:MAG TPA: hypothetical protein VN578_17315 [Candidatus Binatia bacterium]|jgi:hypothetical protein|nr:hypothetical protein [Candidatus Binatia bacterium]